MVEATQGPAQTLSNAYKDLRQAIEDNDHANADASASTILEIDGSDKTLGARRAKLISMIKRREFAEATQFLNKHDYTRRNCMVEAAYILHRQDLNKQALAQLAKVPEDQRESPFYSFTLAQVNYKLGNFAEAVNHFSGPNSDLYGDIGDQVDDLCTNMAACAANQMTNAEKCLKIFDEFEGQLDSAEFNFNISLINLKQ